MRKLTTVIGLVLVLVLALGLVAGVGRSQPARAATGDSVVLAWNQQLLDTFKGTRTGPTIAARALAVVHTAIYDAWAAYDPVAVGTRLGGNLRQPAAERTPDNKTKAVSFAAYASLVDLFPARQGIYRQQMADLGYAVDGSDTSTAAMVGGAAAQAVLDFRHRDGANQLGDEPGGTPGVAYSDYTGYRPVNTWDQVNDPDRWQPLCIPTPPPGATECIGRIQTFLTPHWDHVRPFALTSPGQFRAPGPYTYLGADGKPSGKYVDQVDKMTQYSKQLDDFRKTTAEYWEDGPGTITPPGHWNQFAQWVARRDTNTVDEDARHVLRPQQRPVGCQHQRLGRQVHLGLDPAHQRRAVAAAGQDHPGLGWPLQGPQSTSRARTGSPIGPPTTRPRPLPSTPRATPPSRAPRPRS